MASDGLGCPPDGLDDLRWPLMASDGLDDLRWPSSSGACARDWDPLYGLASPLPARSSRRYAEARAQRDLTTARLVRIAQDGAHGGAAGARRRSVRLLTEHAGVHLPIRRSLRVGLLSADLRLHVMAFLTLGLFEELGRSPHASGREIGEDRGRWRSARRGALHAPGGAPSSVKTERGGAGSAVGAGGGSGLEVWTLSLSADDDSGWQPRFVHAAAAGRRFVNLSEIIDLAGTSAAADRIASLGLDVLIDLNGYTTDERAELLAMGLAPVVMHAVGYPGTMGASFVPYMLLDRYAAPPLATARAREALSERLVLQPHCYQVNDHGRHPLPPSHAQQQIERRGEHMHAARGQIEPQQQQRMEQQQQHQQQQPQQQPPPLPSSQRLVLVNFNQAYKLSRVAGELWCAALLRSGPDSRLWLLRQPDDAEPFLRAELAACGVHERRRVMFAPMVADIPGHLARVATASLGVDTPEYNTHTTGSDALWGGVPMVSAPGEPMAARVASSLLKATAMASGVVGGLKEYVDAVAALVAAS